MRETDFDDGQTTVKGMLMKQKTTCTLAIVIALAALLGYKAAEAKILKELEKIVKRYDDPELFMLELKELIKKGD